MLCLDVLNRSTDDGATLTLAPCDFDEDGEDSSGESEQQWQFLQVCTIQHPVDSREPVSL